MQPSINLTLNLCSHCDGEGYIDPYFYIGFKSGKCQACKGTGLKIPLQNILPIKVLTPSTKWVQS